MKIERILRMLSGADHGNRVFGRGGNGNGGLPVFSEIPGAGYGSNAVLVVPSSDQRVTAPAMSDVPKDVFRQRRTQMALDSIQEGLERLAMHLEGELPHAAAAAKLDLRARVFAFLGDEERLERALKARDAAVRKELERQKRIARRPRKRRRNPEAEQPYRPEKPIDSPVAQDQRDGKKRGR